MALGVIRNDGVLECDGMDRGNCVAAWNAVGCCGVRLGPVAWGGLDILQHPL